MAVNPNGYTPITDGGAPRIITGYAMEDLSGGQFLGASGPADVVGSGTDTFISSDITVFLTEGSGNFIGIALADATSGNPVGIATRGSFIVAVSGADEVQAGTKVAINDDSEVIFNGSHALGYHVAINNVGRAWTTGSDSAFCIVDFHG